MFKLEANKKCLCCSGRLYADCCKVYHEGAIPASALLLMRSRYCAYAKGLAYYLIETTHPTNSQYNPNTTQWEKEILFFCRQTSFEKLKIISFEDGPTEAFVTFHASLKQHSQNGSFTEKSRFLKVDNKWFYVDGTFL